MVVYHGTLHKSHESEGGERVLRTNNSILSFLEGHILRLNLVGRALLLRETSDTGFQYKNKNSWWSFPKIMKGNQWQKQRILHSKLLRTFKFLKKSSHLFWAGLCMSSFHHLLPPAARKPRALHHCGTASLSAWTRRRNLSNSQHVRENLNLPWVWRNLKSLLFSSSFTSKSTIDKGQPSEQKAWVFKLLPVL